MLKRVRWMGMGFVAGVGATYVVTARVRRAVNRYVPSEVRDRVGAQVTARRHDMRAALAEGSAAMAAHEQELRTARDLDRPPKRTA